VKCGSCNSSNLFSIWWFFLYIGFIYGHFNFGVILLLGTLGQTSRFYLMIGFGT
jgi:hypothetical protein